MCVFGAFLLLGGAIMLYMGYVRMDARLLFAHAKNMAKFNLNVRDQGVRSVCSRCSHVSRVGIEWCEIYPSADPNHWTNIRAHRCRVSADRHVSMDVFVASVQ